MILNNYWNYFGYYQTVVFPQSASISQILGCRNISGSDLWAIMGNNNDIVQINYCERNASMKSELGLCVGPSTNDPSPTDYDLQDDFTYLLGNLNYSVSVGIDGNVMKTTAILSGINPSSSNNYHVRQIGVYKNVWNARQGSYVTDKCLFIKHQLEEPIHIEPLQSFVIQLEWVER